MIPTRRIRKMAPVILDSPKQGQKYLYRPIVYPHEIRMVQLLPGRYDEPIQIKISHHPLDDLPRCEALSYEWGPPGGEHEIYCQGNTLRIRENLMEALKELRRTRSKRYTMKAGRLPWRPRLLWIDALCINQDDLVEKSAQVPLMACIYYAARRVVAWIGKAPSLAEEACSLISHLADLITSMKFIERNEWSLDQFPVTFKVWRDYNFEDLVDSPVWSSLENIIGARSYFTRLWVVQEIALSSKKHTIMLCGRFSVKWEQYLAVATLYFINVGTLKIESNSSGLKKLDDSTGKIIIHLNYLQDCLPTSLYDCINSTEMQSVSNPQDRILGLLGLVDTPVQSRIQELDYSTSLGKLFHVATECMIAEEESLTFFGLNAYYVDSSETGVPSWVPWLEKGSVFIPSYSMPFEDNEGRSTMPTIPPVLEGSILTVAGFMFDAVIHASGNLAPRNMKSQLLAFFHQLKKNFASANDDDKTLRRMWDLLSWSEWRGDDESSCLAFIDGITSATPESASPVEIMTIPIHEFQKAGFPFMSPTMSMPVSKFRDMPPNLTEEQKVEIMLQLMFKDTIVFETVLAMVNQHPKKEEGRNIFVTSRGYCGLGPLGDNSSDDLSPVVHVGDQIAILSTAPAPIVLRPLNDGHFSMIGLAELQHDFVDDSEFINGLVGEMTTFRIR